MYTFPKLISIWSCTRLICFELDPAYFPTRVKVSENQSDGSGFNAKLFQMFFALKCTQLSEEKIYIFMWVFKILFQSNFLEENEKWRHFSVLMYLKCCSMSLELFILPVKGDLNSILLTEICFLNNYWCWLILGQSSKQLLYPK